MLLTSISIMTTSQDIACMEMIPPQPEALLPKDGTSSSATNSLCQTQLGLNPCSFHTPLTMLKTQQPVRKTMDSPLIINGPLESSEDLISPETSNTTPTSSSQMVSLIHGEQVVCKVTNTSKSTSDFHTMSLKVEHITSI